jgi:predicted N-formylglutamate amidohydrolase
MTRFPDPFAIQNETGAFPAVFLVEHARNTIPTDMNGLGLAPDYLQEHIAWDIGIEGVARAVSDALDIPAAYCLYSRLIVDANRPIDHPQLFWPASDGIPVPGNHNISEEEKAARLDGIYHPYHQAADNLVTSTVARHGRPIPILAMHSCTPALRGGPFRPWEIGMSTYASDDFMDWMADLLRDEGINPGMHEPYSLRGYAGDSIDIHAHQKKLPHLLIEVRQDLIGDEKGIAEMAALLTKVFQRLPEYFKTEY